MRLRFLVLLALVAVLALVAGFALAPHADARGACQWVYQAGVWCYLCGG